MQCGRVAAPVLLRLHRIVPAGLSTGVLCVSPGLGVGVVALGLLGVGLVRGRRGGLALPAHRVLQPTTPDDRLPTRRAWRAVSEHGGRVE